MPSKLRRLPLSLRMSLASTTIILRGLSIRVLGLQRHRIPEHTGIRLELVLSKLFEALVFAIAALVRSVFLCGLGL